MITDDTMLVTLTAGQLRELIQSEISNAAPSSTGDSDPYGTPVWGANALADYLGVSPEWCSKLIKQKKYGDAIIQERGSRRIGFYPKRLNEKIRQLCNS